LSPTELTRLRRSPSESAGVRRSLPESDRNKGGRVKSSEQVWIDKENRQDSRRIKQTVKFGGNLMMWGCMGWEGIGFATKINGKIDAGLYTEILGKILGVV
jgi:hypothetical protein